MGQSLHLLAAELHGSQAPVSVCRSCPRTKAESSPRKQSEALVCVVFPARLSTSGSSGARCLSAGISGLVLAAEAGERSPFGFFL